MVLISLLIWIMHSFVGIMHSFVVQVKTKLYLSLNQLVSGYDEISSYRLGWILQTDIGKVLQFFLNLNFLHSTQCIAVYFCVILGWQCEACWDFCKRTPRCKWYLALDGNSFDICWSRWSKRDMGMDNCF